MSWWVHDVYQYQGLTTLLSWIFWVLFSITLHELAHGWMAIRQGDDTPIVMQRMTGNPIVHMGPQSLLVFAIIGIAWGVMPVNPQKFRSGRMGDVVVSLAGPMMNVILAIICMTGWVCWGLFGPETEPLSSNVAEFLEVGGYLNVMLAVLNMLPVPPLDGSHILAGLSRPYARFISGPNAPMFALFVLLVIFMTPVGDLLWLVSEELSYAYAEVLANLLGGELVAA